MKHFALILLLAPLAACAAPGEPSGLLSSYEGLGATGNGLRSSLAERREDDALEAVGRIAIRPTQIAAGPDASAAQVKAVVAEARPTGRAGSAVSAAAGFFIPGPVGVRLPGALGGLTAEAEMVGADGRQFAALVWNRNATAVGTGDPSLSRVGDALQFAQAFGDAAGKALSPKDRPSGPVPKPDPCAEYGPRLRAEGYAARFITNLYVPQASGARPAAEGQEAAR